MTPPIPSLLTLELNPIQLRLYRVLLDELAAEFRRWNSTASGTLADTPDNHVRRWVDFLKTSLRADREALDRTRRSFEDFQHTLAAASAPDDQRQIILNFARELGASPRQLRQDRAAFQRWFGADAVGDRYHRRQTTRERRMAFLLQRLGAAGARLFADVRNSQEQMALWDWLDLEGLLQPLLTYEGDPRLNQAAFECLARALAALNPELQELAVDDSILQFIYRSALRSQQNVWIQCAALELLPTLSSTSFEQALQHRLMRHPEGDDLFVRRRAVLLFARHFERLRNPLDLFPLLLNDPSPFVRQAVPKALSKAPTTVAANWLRCLLLEDPAPEVRAATLLEIPVLLPRPDLQEDLLKVYLELLSHETAELVLRTGCLVAEQGATTLAGAQDAFLASWCLAVEPALRRLHTGTPSLKVRRWAAQSAEFLWCENQPVLRSLKLHLHQFLQEIPRGKCRRLPRELSQKVDPDTLARLWSLLARQDFDGQLHFSHRAVWVTRGHVFGFRWWRWWHELRHPSPDKRQAHRHTIGRIFRAEVQVPSAILAELAQTKVPGEPLHLAEESGWRPYLPLPDHLSSLLQKPGPRPRLRLFTSEGITLIEAPRGWRRLQARLALTWHFREFADHRNWVESRQSPPDSYLKALANLGFRITFSPYRDGDKPLPEDPAVRRFFPALLFPAPLTELWERMGQYFVSLYQNTIQELALFILAFGLLFLGLHWIQNLRQQLWRRQIPLVIGGWGTRGKSGTERLKAALFNAMGFSLVSKTTGCEAMLLQAYPFGPMQEMFLFRPYDKATIWEQVNVVRLAARFQADLLLWECMGLTPSYVKILQRSWMRDDFSTITNAYPDHEDIQGPAGYNIPEVIACFIPKRSVVITSEEQMLPILEQEARRLHTQLVAVSWLEAGLIPEDVLKRFPYEEHPYNIALVVKLAEQLGIDHDFALKELADRVVPDLGVLKTYPVATRHSRRLEFTNGMSANERFGTLSNWTRTGFDRQDPVMDPGVWITTVVNNRADRVARSQVFARVLVNDLSADRHFLIGGNLHGLMGYLEEAWAERAPQISLWPDRLHPDPTAGLAHLEHHALAMRLPIGPDSIRSRLRTMLQAQTGVSNIEQLVDLWDQPEELKARLNPFSLGHIASDILSCLKRDRQIHQQYHLFAQRVKDAQPKDADPLDKEFRQLLKQWFQGKIVVIEDYFATGNQIIEIICQHTPPGFLNRIMGIQNIKGTGLDFVYRWQAWDACYHAAQPLRTGKTAVTPDSLRPLAQFQDFGLLSEEFVRDTIAQVKNSNANLSHGLAETLDQILGRLDTVMARLQHQTTGQSDRGEFLTRLLVGLEEFLDAGDAVWRRKQADRIFQDLTNERISRSRATLELQALTQRQKGGWLLKKIQSGK